MGGHVCTVRGGQGEPVPSLSVQPWGLSLGPHSAGPAKGGDEAPGLPCRPPWGTLGSTGLGAEDIPALWWLPSAWAAGHPHRVCSELMAVAGMGLLSGDQGPKADSAALVSVRGAHRRGAPATGPPCPQSSSLQLPRGQHGARDCPPLASLPWLSRPLDIGLTLPSPQAASLCVGRTHCGCQGGRGLAGLRGGLFRTPGSMPQSL